MKRFIVSLFAVLVLACLVQPARATDFRVRSVAFVQPVVAVQAFAVQPVVVPQAFVQPFYGFQSFAVQPVVASFAVQHFSAFAHVPFVQRVVVRQRVVQQVVRQRVVVQRVRIRH